MRFWGLKSRPGTRNYVNLPMTSHDSAQDEENKVRLQESEQAEVDGLRVVDLDKLYKRGWLGGRTTSDIHAVKNLYLSVGQNEMLALLGHNGAGKTTLLNMLTGLLSPSAGTARFFGFDLQEDLEEIRKIVGYCPQNNVLWEELTAREHLTLFATLKNITKELIPAAVTAKLQEVELEVVADCPVSSFSGGMKRRLSVAIAGTGNPGVIFLDEPTTGLDPISRRFVWELIKNLKLGRAIIMTTHSMDEAEILGDRIAIMSQGQLKCIGNALYLKSRYGDGFEVNMTSKQPRVVGDLLEKHFPKVKLKDESAGSLVCAVPYSDVASLMPLLIELESETGMFGDSVDEWIVSHATMEDVFGKITAEPCS